MASPNPSLPVRAVMLFQVSALLARAFVQQRMVSRGVDPAFAVQAAAGAGYVVLAVLLLPVFRTLAATLRPMLARPRDLAELVPRAVAIGVLLRVLSWSIAVAALAAGAPGRPGPPFAPVLNWSCPAPGLAAIHIAILVLLTPVVEEMLHRGVVLPALLRRGAGIAVCLSALWFAVLHPPRSMPDAFVFGVLAAVMTMRSGSLWPALTAHGVVNLLAFLDTACLGAAWNPVAADVPAAATAVAVGALAAGLAIGLAAGTPATPGGQAALTRKTRRPAR